MRIGGVARGRVVKWRADGERNGVTRVFNEVDDVTVVQTRDIVMINSQNTITDVQLRTPLGWAVGDDLTDERNSFRHRGDDDEAKTFVFSSNYRYVIRVNHSASISDSARISRI